MGKRKLINKNESANGKFLDIPSAEYVVNFWKEKDSQFRAHQKDMEATMWGLKPTKNN